MMHRLPGRPGLAVCALDHLVVTAPSLDVGARYVERALGVALQPGGEHSRMGTHNLLLRLGATAYLEVISTNPAAPHPGRARWFALDDPDACARPRLSTWVARTSSVQASLATTRENLGPVELMSRGDLEWQITVPSNGRPPFDGVVPALIQWPDGRHPASNLRDAGCALLRLEAYHSDPGRVSELIDCLGLHDAISVRPLPRGEPGYLSACIDTPGGPRIVATPDFC